jgi:hypothetical protein
VRLLKALSDKILSRAVWIILIHNPLSSLSSEKKIPNAKILNLLFAGIVVGSFFEFILFWGCYVLVFGVVGRGYSRRG